MSPPARKGRCAAPKRRAGMSAVRQCSGAASLSSFCRADCLQHAEFRNVEKRLVGPWLGERTDRGDTLFRLRVPEQDLQWRVAATGNPRQNCAKRMTIG